MPPAERAPDGQPATGVSGTGVHHVAIRTWFAAHHAHGWATCPITESGFARVSSNPNVRLVTFDAGLATLAGDRDVEQLTAL